MPLARLAGTPLARLAGTPLALLALALLAPACGPHERAPAIPDGVHLLADGPALGDALGRLAGLHGTPLGRTAAELASRLSGCATVAGSVAGDDVASLPGALACTAEAPAARAREASTAFAARASEGPGVLSALAALRGEDDLALVVPAGRRHRLLLTGRRGAAGGWRLRARVEPPEAEGVLALLLPAEAPAGAPVLAEEGTVLHARVRPREGIDVAALVPEGSQGDRLFRLRSALFSSAVLAGVWEIAVYMPEPGAALPPLAAALDVRDPEAAEAAAREFIARLGATWPVQASPLTLPGARGGRGACLLDLRILPEFAPCWATTGRALVVGWNPPSLARALAGPASASEGEPSRLSVRLADFPEADRRLRAARAGEGDEPGPARAYGWERLEVRASADAELRIALAGDAGEEAP